MFFKLFEVDAKKRYAQKPTLIKNNNFITHPLISLP